MKKRSFFTYRRKSKGAVLIEFGYAAPILIMALYATIDLSKYYFRRFQMENACKYAANMIQTISLKRDDKQITVQDLDRVFHAAFLGVFVGESSKKKYMTMKYVRGVSYEEQKIEEKIKENIIDKNGEGKDIKEYLLITPAEGMVEVMYSYTNNNINNGGGFGGVPLPSSTETLPDIIDGTAEPTTNIYKNLPPIPVEEGVERIVLELGMLNSSPGLLGMLFGTPPVLEDIVLTDVGSVNYVTISSVITFDPEDGLFVKSPPITTPP